MTKAAKPLPKALLPTWEKEWEPSLACWSSHLRLSKPRFCLTNKDEKAQGLTQSFAMIRLTDHAVVISLKQVAERNLGEFPRQILAHEIGHHVLTPADLTDNAKLQARTRAGLPGREQFAPYVANLYADILINDRLQRSAGLDMAEVFRALNRNAVKSRGKGTPGSLWSLYLLIYEFLWALPPGDLAGNRAYSDDRLRVDGDLGARLARVYSRDWLGGAGRFAALCLPHLMADTPKKKTPELPPWLDALKAGAGSSAPDGLTDLEPEEIGGARHPANDPSITGLDLGDTAEPGDGAGQTDTGGTGSTYRPPSEYTELMQALGVELSTEELIMKYYREKALPHLIPFPKRRVFKAVDPVPEGVEPWDPSSPLADVDWIESLIRSPLPIPGVTTVQRTYGEQSGFEPEDQPVDLYVGVDCSGSMTNPKIDLSYPVLASVIMTLSALRAGARAMVCLSGEHPGSPNYSRYAETPGFVRQTKTVLTTLTNYLGSGSAYGVGRLKAAFLDPDAPHETDRPTHILIITDLDIFMMLDGTKGGWSIAERAVAKAGAGGTMVLHAEANSNPSQTEQLRGIGYDVFHVQNWEDVVAFAREFSRTLFQGQGAGAKHGR